VPGCICDPQQEPTAPQPALDHAAMGRADDPAAHGEGGHSGHSLVHMAEQMRNRFFASLAFTLAILAWSDVGKSVFGSHLATPFGLDRNVWLLLLSLPEDETVVFEDEVDLNLNPKIGSMWMLQGQQAEVVTPGDNDKCYAAGSLHWRTGKLFTTIGPKRDGELFVRHLHELRRKLRRYRKIHVICDNAKFHHDCWAVWEFCRKYGDRVQLHCLPKYAPELNPLERAWWRLHERITRNQQCQSLEELVDLVLAWLSDRKSLKVQDAAYLQPKPKAKDQAA